jgi:SAM-dependent methyltransferase
MMTENMAPSTVNRSWWDRLAGSRRDDVGREVEAFMNGQLCIDERERSEVDAAIGDISGSCLLHLQCNIGLGTLSLAKLGADVTGVDFSAVAIARARELATLSGLRAVFLEEDAQYLPPILANRFDLVFASYGIFYWIENLHAWMRSATEALRGGGKLVVVETHPLAQMFRSADPAIADFPYGGGRPRRRRDTARHPGQKTPIPQHETIGYAHGIGDIITAAIAAGLHIDAFNEYLDGALPESQSEMPLTLDESGRYRLIVGGEALPVTLSLRATKHG